MVKEEEGEEEVKEEDEGEEVEEEGEKVKDAECQRNKMKTTALTLTVTEAPLVTGLLALLCTCAQLATTSTLNVATKSSLNVAATSTLKEDILHVFLLMFNRHFTTLPWND